ncbi:hypothetical protein E3N88_23846 [Mikania micrantha]|uniref:Tf2-1-like SH3-like domain-containing protein n=1 Tax=Mikania micrantha TaxID=192012 RepID=A0A5N6NGZ0_9ASTR|nr:hypothetical protein E3N88_23846 [Mikania micrantha]
MAQVGKVAYRLDLPDELSGIHPTFHVSHLRKCLADDVAYVPLNDIEVDEKLNYIEESVAILDTKEKQLRNKTIRQVKVQWKHRKGSEATWETEDEMNDSTHICLKRNRFRGRNLLHRPRSRRKCDIEVPAAVGQDLSTAVRRTVYDMMV